MNRAERRTMERIMRRPPPKFDHSKVLMMPMPFAATPAMRDQLGLRERVAIDGVMKGTGSFEDFQFCVTAAVTTANACAIVAKTPALADQIDGIEDVRSWLAGECKAALQGIYSRHRETGRIGVTGTERAALAKLGELTDSMRTALPRRILHLAFQRTLKVSTLAAALGLE